MQYLLKMYKEAITSYSRVLAISPDNSELYQSRGDCRFKLDDLAGANADYSRALELNPRAGQTYYRRGVVKVQMGERESGCQDLLMAKQFGVAQADELLRKNCR
jgi:tetratricopeptide (TPR) repeat protein